MLDAHKRLSDRFFWLRESRTGPVFFIEHGLEESELDYLAVAVRNEVRHHPPGDSWWRERPLPLLVRATEVGYRYRGNGTDYWPTLESDLRVSLDRYAREHIRDLFEACCRTYRGIRPPDSPWAKIFRLIAWPITHALLPHEFHYQLSTTLANLRTNILTLDDASLCRAVRRAARHPSLRFASFLEDEDLVAPVVRALLNANDDRISQDTITRFGNDLRSNPDVRRNISRARRIQRKPPSEPSRRMPLSIIQGHLLVRRHVDNVITLEARFPQSTDKNIDRLRRFLRRRRFAPKLWSVSSPVPSEQILSGVPFALKMNALPADEAPLFDQLSELGVADDLLPVLESFRLDFRLPLLFAANADRDLARNLHGMDVSEHREYWLLVERGSKVAVSELSLLGEIGPCICYSLHTEERAARIELERLGYRVRSGFAISFAGAPPLEADNPVPRFLHGDDRIVVPHRRHPPGTHIQLGSETIPFDTDLVRARVTQGKHVLEFSNPERTRREPFEGLADYPVFHPPLCRIELGTTEMTVQALFGGRMPLKIDGPAPLAGLELTVELETSGQSVNVTCALDPLPYFLPGDHDIWHALLDNVDRERILRDPYPVLRARVGSLAAESWTLEQNLRPCWWVHDSLRFELQSELGPLEYGLITVEEPAAPPTREDSERLDGACLLAPLDPDEVELGPMAQFTTFFMAPDKLELAAPHMNKPRLVRTRRGDAGSLGIEDLTEAWFRWVLAESASAIANVRRHQVAAQLDSWLVEIVCGESWAQQETLLNASFADPWMLLSDELHDTGLGRDEYVGLSSQRDESERIRLAVAEIRRTYPELWMHIDSPSSPNDHGTLLEASTYEILDQACERAYLQLAEGYRDAGRIEKANALEDADPGAAEDEWDRVLERVKARSELRELGELLLPTDKAQQLITLDLEFMPLADIVEELRRWTSGSAFFGRLPDDAVLETLLALWIAPETAVVRNWRSALDHLLVERPLARAARYLALRARGAQLRGA